MIDRVEIHVNAGKGGDGRVSFLRLKYMPKGGPDGGDGGRGGSVYAVGDKDLNTLRHFLGARRYSAEPGGEGGKRHCHGANGSDLEIKVPIGTIISGVGEILEDGQKLLLAEGGEGGLGNDHFKHGGNTTPMFAKKGEPGEEKDLVLELRLLANIGLVGFPNAGKSTLLSVLTKARPEIANYPFTTLSPNLGVITDLPGANTVQTNFVIADIPGLIEGASQGKGLGHDFLRHVERCQMLVFVLALDDAEAGTDLSDDERGKKLAEQARVLGEELRAYNPEILQKQAVVFLSKSDLWPTEASASLVQSALLAHWPTFLPSIEEKNCIVGSSAGGIGMVELKQRFLELLQVRSEEFEEIKNTATDTSLEATEDQSEKDM